jgi:rod shape-determining protein MreC
MGPWAFLTHNLTFALLTLAALILFLTGRSQGSWADTARSFVQDVVSPAFVWFAGPSSAVSRWTEGLGAAVDVYAENQRLREENAKLLAFQNEAIELRQKVTRYEALLRAGPQPGSAFVTGRVIADSGGPFARSLIVGVGSALGVAKGQAVSNEQGLVGHIVNAGRRSARVLLVTDSSSRVPVRLERANAKAILAGDNSADPYLDFLPRNSVLIAGDRVVTASDGNIFPPGIPVGVVKDINGKPRVDLFADERRADFVRILKYEVPIDVDEAPAEPMPGSRPREPQPPVEPGPPGPPVVAQPRDGGQPLFAPAGASPAPAQPGSGKTGPVQSGRGRSAPASENRR